MINIVMKKILLIVSYFIIIQIMGCASWSNTAKGGVIGATAGGALGTAIGAATGKTALGAVIGAAVGGTAGILIGKRMDKQAEEMQEDLKNARIERVGEGIVVTFDSGILFDFDRAELKPQAKTNISELSQTLQKYEDTDIMIVGHTDSQGDEAYNLKLSERRASSVATYVAAQGVSSSRIQQAGRGEAEPVASNDSGEGRQQNRRVEIAIFANEKMKKAAKRGDLPVDNQ